MAPLRQGVYWDTCIFYALLKQEEHRPGELSAIKKQARAFEKGDLHILTSAITLIEVLPAKLNDQAIKQFSSMHERDNFNWIDTNTSVAKLASHLRSKYTKQHSVSKKTLRLSAPDAIHIASAIATEIPQFITFDCNDKLSFEESSILHFSDDIHNDFGLRIMRPDTTGQQELDLANDR